MASPQFRTEFDPAHGRAVEILPQIVRVTANNPGPFTFHGTNSYVVGDRSVCVIDPGPSDEAHLRVLMQAIDGRPVSAILVSHTHADHSPLAAPLSAATGAPVLAQGVHRPARELHRGEVNSLDASADRAFAPDRLLAHGEQIDCGEFGLEAVFTPGHAANHLCFSWPRRAILFSADHVMGWSTSIVAPPDGSMADYMRSLDVLLERNETCYLPGHGGSIERPQEFVRALRAHRRMREAAILARIRAGDETIDAIVAVLYRDTDPKLHGAAALSVFAHIEDLLESGRIATDGVPSIKGLFRPA